jgi:hypothetical protein
MQYYVQVPIEGDRGEERWYSVCDDTDRELVEMMARVAAEGGVDGSQPAPGARVMAASDLGRRGLREPNRRSHQGHRAGTANTARRFVVRPGSDSAAKRAEAAA